jgi:dolichol kinase
MTVLYVTVLLLLWNLVVIHYVSRWFYALFAKVEGVPAEYVGRKVVHILGGGLTAILVPLFFDGSYWVVSAAAFLLAGYTYLWRTRGRLHWFQVEENAYEVHFALAYGAVLTLGVLLGDVWIGLVPILFMSFGDSATGLVRAFTQRRRVKSWDGTLAMFLVCAVIGLWRYGAYGLVVAGLVSLVEKIPGVDDNLTVPLVAVALAYLPRVVA